MAARTKARKATPGKRKPATSQILRSTVDIPEDDYNVATCELSKALSVLSLAIREVDDNSDAKDALYVVKDILHIVDHSLSLGKLQQETAGNG